MPDTPLNPEVLESASRVNDPEAWAMIDDTPNDPGAMRLRESLIAEAGRTVSAYLTVAQPEVNSVESIPAQVQVISWEEEPEHECWKLAPDETFVGLIVKSDRAWSPADRYTLNIERPAVKP